MDLSARLLLGAAIAVVVLVLTAAHKLLSLLLRCHRAKRLWSSSPIPGPPLSSKLTGHIPDLMGPKGPWALLRWTNQYGCMYKLQFLDVFAVVLTDPGVMARITRKSGPGPYLPKSREIYEAMEVATRPKRPNILTAEDGEYWKAIRQAAAPCFSLSNLKQVVPLVLSMTQRAVNHIAGQEVVDVADAAKRITSDVMGHLLYGEDLKGTCWEPSEYLEVLYPVLKAESALFNNPFHLWQLWDPEVRLQRRCLAKHDALIGEKVARMRREPPAPHTIAAHILTAVHPSTGRPIDDTYVKGEIGIFMAAGFETTSHAITWCLTVLAAHPDVQEQVLVELQAAGLAPAGKDSASPPQDFQASDLGRLPLLSAVIKEALRVCAPVPYGGSRHVVMEEGAELCGYHVPKGTIVMMPLLPYGLAHHLYGADATSFRPERWLTGAAGVQQQQLNGGGSLSAGPTTDAVGKERPAPPDPLTFMTGQRDCIGQNLAKLELQVVLATLLSRFQFSPGPELQRELDLAAATGQSPVEAVHALAGDSITLQPLSGHMGLKLAARS